MYTVLVVITISFNTIYFHGHLYMTHIYKLPMLNKNVNVHRPGYSHPVVYHYILHHPQYDTNFRNAIHIPATSTTSDFYAILKLDPLILYWTPSPI